MSNEVTLQQYWDSLNRHDWYYDYSDDHSVWQRGSAELSRLRAMSKQSPEHTAMFEGFKKHYFSGESWGTEKAPKPVRPE